MIKKLLLGGIRAVHSVLRHRELPTRIAIYYHELEKRDRDRFREGLEYLVSQGYVSVDAAGYISEEGPARRLFISFDDNFCDWHEVLDLLDQLDLKATFYVNSGVFHDRSTLAEQRDFMRRISQPEDKRTLTVEELRNISARGHTIGCHTHTHPVLSILPREKWNREIEHSKKVLERLTGKPVLDFSFPYGMRRDFSRKLETYCEGLGFRSIATGISGQLYTEKPNPFQLHRTGWKFELPLSENLKNLSIDGRLYALLFGRSVIG